MNCNKLLQKGNFNQKQNFIYMGIKGDIMTIMPIALNSLYTMIPYFGGVQYPMFFQPSLWMQRDGLGGAAQTPLHTGYFDVFNNYEANYTDPLNFNYNSYPFTNYYYPQSNYMNYYGVDSLQNYSNYAPVNYSFGDLTLGNKKKSLAEVSEKLEISSKSLNLSDKELDRLGFNTPNLKMRWKHLKPEFQRALIKLTNYAESKGIKISYGRRSTWRSHQDQIDMKNERGHFAAKPGNSPHEHGIAVDITTTSVNGNTRSNRENQALLGAYWESLGYRWGGHFKNFAKEPWHFDLKRTRS